VNFGGSEKLSALSALSAVGVAAASLELFG